MTDPPRWSREQLKNDLLQSIAIFRRQRMQEPLEAYLEAFDEYQGVFEDLLETTLDLAALDDVALEVLTNPHLLRAVLYLPGPPVSRDDLMTLGEAALSPRRLRKDPAMVGRILDVIRSGLDRRRFAWVAENRDPLPAEREAAILASAALLATSRVGMDRRMEGKASQEEQLRTVLLTHGLRQVDRRKVEVLGQAPGPGEFCGESLLGRRKADFILGLWDRRVMPIECKVSNSAVNSVKRLNNDAAAKAEEWTRDFGQLQVVPVAVLGGVYKLENLESAQRRGLSLFWAHNLGPLTEWIQTTRR